MSRIRGQTPEARRQRVLGGRCPRHGLRLGIRSHDAQAAALACPRRRCRYVQVVPLVWLTPELWQRCQV